MLNAVTAEIALSEETRLDTVHMSDHLYDTHWVEAHQIYVLCEHGTTDIVAIMTSDFWHQLMGDE